MNNINMVNHLLRQGKGVFFTSNASQAGLTNSHLVKLIEQGIIERIERGVYIKAGDIDDKLFFLQQRAKKIIYSHETALFLHSLTDRIPNKYSITVPSFYKPSQTIKSACKVYYINQDLISLGKTKLPSGMGHEIISYNIERTICDILRSRNKIDSQVMTDALKQFVLRKDVDFNRLGKYAKKFNVDKLLHKYLEVLL